SPDRAPEPPRSSRAPRRSPPAPPPATGRSSDVEPADAVVERRARDAEQSRRADLAPAGALEGLPDAVALRLRHLLEHGRCRRRIGAPSVGPPEVEEEVLAAQLAPR